MERTLEGSPRREHVPPSSPEVSNRPVEQLETPPRFQAGNRPESAPPVPDLGSPERPLSPAALETTLQAGLIENLPGEITPSPELPRAPRPEVITEPTPVEDSDDDLLQPSLLQRLGRNKTVRALMGALNLFGVAKGMDAAVDAYRDQEHNEAVQEAIVDIAYSSSLELTHEPETDFTFQHQLDLDRTVTLEGDTTMKGSELMDQMNKSLSVNAEGLSGLVEHIADTRLSDGSQGVDAFRFYLAYNDQIPMSESGTELLQAATGLSEKELDSVAEVVRDSVLQMPDVRMGVTGRIFYHGDQLNAIDYQGETAKLHEARLDQAIDIALETVQSLDVDTMSDSAREQAVEIIQEAIRATIDADNALTTAANYTAHWDEPLMQKGFSTGSEAQPSMLDKILEANTNAELSLKKLAALEHGQGQVHALAEALAENLDAKGEAFFEKAREIDPASPAFEQGLNHFKSGEQAVARAN